METIIGSIEKELGVDIEENAIGGEQNDIG